MATTILMADICKRYGCAESTVYEWMLKGFPRPVGKFGRSNVWSMADIEAWERIHLRGLHFPGVRRVDEEDRFDADDTEKWLTIRANLRRAEQQLREGKTKRHR
jgi:predicted DNA-binding transcriptional regulator AlpA